jgi:hypothetical protein
LRQIGKVAVVDPLATVTESGGYRVKACIDVSKAGLVDQDGKSVVKANRPPRVSYRFLVDQDGRRWYVMNEKALGTC